MKHALCAFLILSAIASSNVQGQVQEGDPHKRETTAPGSDLKSNKMEAATRDMYFRAGVQKLDVPVRAPDFTLRQLGNGMISLQELRGKVVLLNFFSPSCPICQKESTSFDTLSNKFREGQVAILQVAVEADEAELMNFRKEYHISLPILIDEERRTAKAYGVWGHHESFFLNRKGMIVGKTFKVKNWNSSSMIKLIRHLLAEQK